MLNPVTGSNESTVLSHTTVPWFFSVHGIHGSRRYACCCQILISVDNAWNRQIELLSSRVSKNVTDHQRIKKEAWQLVDTGCELWPKRTKKSTHLNISCFDPILSNGNNSATGQMGKKTNQPTTKTGGDIPEDGSPNLQTSIHQVCIQKYKRIAHHPKKVDYTLQWFCAERMSEK